MLIVCAGGCGAKTVNRLRYKDEDHVVAIGSPSDVSVIKRDDVVRLVVDAGSDTGAHRDFNKAFEQLDGQLDGVIENAKRAVRAGELVTVVFGIGGAVGAAVARHLLDAVPAAIVATVPAPDEPERSHAAAQLAWLMEARKFKNSPFYLYENESRGVVELDKVARKVFALREYAPQDLPNIARPRGKRVIFIDDEPVSIDKAVSFLRVADAKFKGSIQGPVAESRDFELKLEDKYERKEEDLDPLDFL